MQADELVGIPPFAMGLRRMGRPGECGVQRG
jgi:hypothetical protein